jgi:hypothetical protein
MDFKIEVYKDGWYVGKFKANVFAEKQDDEHVRYLIDTWLKRSDVGNVEYDYNGSRYLVEKI